MTSPQNTKDLRLIKSHYQVTNRYHKSGQRSTKIYTPTQMFRHSQTLIHRFTLRKFMSWVTLAKRTKNTTAKLKRQKKILDSRLWAAGASIGKFREHKINSIIRHILFSHKWFFQGWVHRSCSSSLPYTSLPNKCSHSPTYQRQFTTNNRNSPTPNFNLSKAQWWTRH